MKRYLSLAVSAIALAACSNPAPESSAPESDTAETQTDAQSTERTAGYNEDRNAYFGDLHIRHLRHLLLVEQIERLPLDETDGGHRDGHKA